MKQTKKYTIILQPESDPRFRGYYNAIVPALPGCFSYGADRREALSNIREAIELYIEDLLDAGESIPEDRTEQVQLEVMA